MSASKEARLVLNLPPLDPPTAAWLIDLCGHLQTAIFQKYGDELEAYWTATEPNQPIYGPLEPPRRKKTTKR
jgi:hypothetical protein